jgi:RNA recognition motif-containing protein
MIRNIPSKLTQEDLIEEIREVTHFFNFVYLPQSNSGRGNVGYAFVNFTTQEDALSFMEVFQGHSFSQFPSSDKCADVALAVLQGFKANVRFYKNLKITDTEFGPYINSRTPKTQKN